MIKIVITVILVGLFSFFGFNQENLKDKQGRKQGEWVKYHEKSNVPVYEGQFIDDKPVGKFTYYYPSNKIKAIVNHDPKTGRSEAYMYYENKELLAHGIYINKKKDSVWTHYTRGGNISFKETYRNDTLHGKKIIYHTPENPEALKGQPVQEMIFENGVLEGPTKQYFPDGALKLEGNYKDGKFDGVVKRYSPEGWLEHLERYKDKKEHGWWILYDHNGKELARKYYYKGNALEGEELKTHMEKLKEEGGNPNH